MVGNDATRNKKAVNKFFNRRDGFLEIPMEYITELRSQNTIMGPFLLIKLEKVSLVNMSKLCATLQKGPFKRSNGIHDNIEYLYDK